MLAYFHTFNLIGPIAPISFFLRTSEETNCAARLATPILTAASLFAIRLAPVFSRAASGSASTVLLVWLPLARLNRARPAAVFTKGILKDFLRLIVRPLDLAGVRRRFPARARRRDEALRPRRASLQAFLLIPPACLIAHLGSFPRLATQPVNGWGVIIF